MVSTLHDMVLQAATKYAHENAVCFHASQEPAVFYTYKNMMKLADELAVFLKLYCSNGESCKIGLYCNPGINLPSYIMG
ncbi:hypothetical protein GDO86_000411 [Hymenochirus boettgeri]|uniref:Uncharacterized protein n=1 Tax=Hymenochirus boettgeri TaxID=247094 RepID=A0A8T2KBZ0_9PIPI|nr:hypothetical protein GDO86_000411 [Hymenochirus boettgeri]